MASPKQIFLVALLLTLALASHGGRICQSNKDCGPCKVGRPLCLDGLCTCLDKKADDDVADQKLTGRCRAKSDCSNICRKGCSSYNCIRNICFCSC